MSVERFKREYSGELGEFWKKEADKEVAKRLEQYENGELLIDEYGVAYWASNNNALPEECALQAKYAGLPVNLDLTRELEINQVEKSLNEYRERKKNHVYTEEEIGEMRAEFGEGQVIVDAITGQKINTGYWKRV